MIWFRKKPVAYKCDSMRVSGNNMFSTVTYSCCLCKREISDDKALYLVTESVPISVYLKVLNNLIDIPRTGIARQMVFGFGCIQECSGAVIITCKKCFKHHKHLFKVNYPCLKAEAF